jgi:Bacterial regulatory proteins, tetR family
MSPSPPGSRVQRRAARTKAAIEDAFVQLVLERGYERSAVEDITDRADLARATFYAHYPNTPPTRPRSRCPQPASTSASEDAAVPDRHRTGDSSIG